MPGRVQAGWRNVQCWRAAKRYHTVFIAFLSRLGAELPLETIQGSPRSKVG